MHLGAIALYRNDLEAAERHLKVALDIVPASKQAKGLLINVYYRGDKFEEAAPLYRAVGDEVAAKKFESFKGLKPYQIDGKADVTRVPFIITDPLPLIAAKVNGRPVNFLIDTGAAELFVDPDLVKKANIHRFGETTRKGYAGGLKVKTGAGRIDSVTLGQTTIHNVPVQILNTKRFSAVAQGKRVDGVLGTSLLSHFLATLDYPKGELVLRPKTPGNRDAFLDGRRSLHGHLGQGQPKPAFAIFRRHRLGGGRIRLPALDAQRRRHQIAPGFRG